MILPIDKYSSFIKSWSKELGFDYCGITKAEPLEDDKRRLENWLNKGYHGKMSYMENHFDIRTNPQLIVPGAKSVVTLLFNYYPPQTQKTDGPKISKYAYGPDYHDIIRPKLKELLMKIHEEIGAVEGRGFVDSAPVLERSLAVKSGLGWVGKNGNMITKHSGSFFFIANLIIDLPLKYDDPFVKDYCGTCTKCIDFCPTDAIVSPTIIDGSKCISYLTIELKDEFIPSEFQDQMENWIFGCDICQDVCPWNRFSQPHTKPELEGYSMIMDFNTEAWEMMNEDLFRALLKHSPLRRPKWKGIHRNIQFSKKTE